MTPDLRDVETIIRRECAMARMFQEPRRFIVDGVIFEVGNRSDWHHVFREYKDKRAIRARQVMP